MAWCKFIIPSNNIVAMYGIHCHFRWKNWKNWCLKYWSLMFSSYHLLPDNCFISWKLVWRYIYLRSQVSTGDYYRHTKYGFLVIDSVNNSLPILFLVSWCLFQNLQGVPCLVFANTLAFSTESILFFLLCLKTSRTSKPRHWFEVNEATLVLYTFK